jgi:hypothetical protein
MAYRCSVNPTGFVFKILTAENSSRGLTKALLVRFRQEGGAEQGFRLTPGSALSFLSLLRPDSLQLPKRDCMIERYVELKPYPKAG